MAAGPSIYGHAGASSTIDQLVLGTQHTGQALLRTDTQQSYHANSTSTSKKEASDRRARRMALNKKRKRERGESDGENGKTADADASVEEGKPTPAALLQDAKVERPHATSSISSGKAGALEVRLLVLVLSIVRGQVPTGWLTHHVHHASRVNP